MTLMPTLPVVGSLRRFLSLSSRLPLRTNSRSSLSARPDQLQDLTIPSQQDLAHRIPDASRPPQPQTATPTSPPHSTSALIIPQSVTHLLGFQ